MVVDSYKVAFEAFENIQCVRVTIVIIISYIMSAVYFAVLALRPKPIKSPKSKKGPPKESLSSAK